MGAYVSLHGRALGFDADTLALIRYGKEGNYGNEAVTAASTASNINQRGLTTLGVSTANKAFTIDAPSAGADGLRKRLVATSTSTFSRTVTVSSGAIQSTGGSTFTTLTFSAVGQSIELAALSTALWGIISNAGGVTCT